VDSAHGIIPQALKHGSGYEAAIARRTATAGLSSSLFLEIVLPPLSIASVPLALPVPSLKSLDGWLFPGELQSSADRDTVPIVKAPHCLLPGHSPHLPTIPWNVKKAPNTLAKPVAHNPSPFRPCHLARMCSILSISITQGTIIDDLGKEFQL